MHVDVNETARRMIDRYGKRCAKEYAYGYAVGVYFKQNEAGRSYWLRVEAAIDAMEETNQ